GSPQRAAGVRARTRSLRPGTSLRADCVNGVSIQPGKIALTWMLSFAPVHASRLVIATMPPLLAAYAAANDAPKIESMEPMLTILPPPPSFMCGYAAWAQRNAPFRLVSMILFHSASV